MLEIARQKAKAKSDMTILIEASLIQAVFGDRIVFVRYAVKLVLAIGMLCLQVQGLDFSTAPIPADNHTFGSLSIGGVHSKIWHTSGNRTMLQDYESARNAVIFGLKRGVMLGNSKAFLLNAWIDGSAGSENKNGFYAFSLGGQMGYRFFNGRVICLVGGGFEMSNLAMPDVDEQYNIYGGLVRAELFFDIARGYGLSIGYQQGFNYKSKKLLDERFDTSRIMLTLSYYDFSI
ncbi:hypothetical protein [uncultured Helicobacter sp.]|uniref:hypothetical protein n=2 Tax=uncultured Helicobacter sp. TaxID=175537 RepID=UPI00262BF40B|nr:hypothetical protein [uncultured Helicobacter sp.]